MIIIAKKSEFQVKCKFCEKLWDYSPQNPDTDKNPSKKKTVRKRKLCSKKHGGCGRKFPIQNIFSTTLKEQANLFTRKNSNQIQKLILDFIESQKRPCVHEEIEQYLKDNGFAKNLSYHKIYRSLNKLISQNLLKKVRSSQNFYSLSNQPAKYKLSKIPWPKLYAIHRVQYKYLLDAFPPNWKSLRELFPECKMLFWDGDGRRIDYDDEIRITTTPSSILVEFKKGYRCFAKSIKDGEEYVINKFDKGPIQHLKKMGFQINPAPPQKTTMEYAFSEIMLSKSKERWNIVNENGIPLLKKDGSPNEFDELETDDEGIAQTILDVSKGYKNNQEEINRLSKTQSKIASDLTVFSSQLENTKTSLQDRIETLEIRTDKLTIESNDQDKNYQTLMKNFDKVLGMFEKITTQIEKKDRKMENLESKISDLNQNLSKFIQSSKLDPEPGGLYT